MSRKPYDVHSEPVRSAWKAMTDARRAWNENPCDETRLGVDNARAAFIASLGPNPGKCRLVRP
jgi:hypothetical protein